MQTTPPGRGLKGREHKSRRPVHANHAVGVTVTNQGYWLDGLSENPYDYIYICLLSTPA